MIEELIAVAMVALLAGGAVLIGVSLFRRDRAWPTSAIATMATALGLAVLLRRRRGRWQ